MNTSASRRYANATASSRMKSRVLSTTAPRMSTPPDSHGGAVTLTAGAPKMSRATCWRISPTPTRHQEVSSGQPVIHPLDQRGLQQHAEQAADENPTTETSRRQRHFGTTSDDGRIRVTAGHDELAVRHVDDAHLPEGQPGPRRPAAGSSRGSIRCQHQLPIRTSIWFSRTGPRPTGRLQERVRLDRSPRHPRPCRSGRRDGSRRSPRSW